MTRAWLRLATSVSLLVATLGLIVLGCWAAAADAQGAINLVVFAVWAITLSIGALLLAREAGRLGAGTAASVAGITAAALLGFHLVFLACLFVPAGKPLPTAMIALVASSFEALTGETPYAFAHRP